MVLYVNGLVCPLPLDLHGPGQCAGLPAREASAGCLYPGGQGELGALGAHVRPRAGQHRQQPEPALRQPAASLLHPLLPQGEGQAWYTILYMVRGRYLHTLSHQG